MKNKKKDKLDLFWKVFGIGLLISAAVLTVSIIVHNSSLIGMGAANEPPTILAGILCVLFGEGIFFLWKKNKQSMSDIPFIIKKILCLFIGVVLFFIAVLVGFLIRGIVWVCAQNGRYALYGAIGIIVVVCYFVINWLIDESRG